MKPSPQFRLSQHLTLTPQLQQSIRLLQLSTVELNQEIDRLLMENPALEREDHEDVGGGGGGGTRRGGGGGGGGGGGRGRGRGGGARPRPPRGRRPPRPTGRPTSRRTGGAPAMTTRMATEISAPRKRQRCATIRARSS